MIARSYIEEWREFAPWVDNSQVEQDLILERCLIEIFNDPYLNEHLAFRGGTALHKLFFQKPVRYSEDIDLVQINAIQVGTILTHLRKVLSFIEGKVTVDHGPSMVALNFQYLSEMEPIKKMKVKIEINCREHFNVLGYRNFEYVSRSSWYKNSAGIRTYKIEELLGTKLRALYQRNKGRDLFDIGYTMENLNPDPVKIVNTFKEYLAFNGLSVTYKEFMQNLENKMNNVDFVKDISGLIRPGIHYQIDKLYQLVKLELIDRLA